MADPLRLLHEYATGRRHMRDVTGANGEKYIAFGDLAYQRDVHTNLTVYGKENEYYTLESLLLLWEQRGLNHPAYVKDAAGKNIRAVTRPDRREILEYLKGERTALPSNHDELAAIPPPIPVSRIEESEGPERKKAKLDVPPSQRIDALLDKQGDAEPDASQLRALNSELTADRIAALKKKVRNHQRKTITATIEDHDMDGCDVPAASSTRAAAASDGRGQQRERVWRNRHNCLESANKVFTPILQILQSLKVRDEAVARQKSLGMPTSSSSKPTQARGGATRAAGYSRYDQEVFSGKSNAGEFQIDDQMTFVGSSLRALTQHTTKTDVKPMGGIPPPQSRPSMGPPSSSTPASATPDQNSGGAQRKRTSRTPIIIIPAANTSLITMYNVVDVLQDMRFVTTEQKKAQGTRRENEALIQRKKGNITVPYRVVDNPMKLSADEWDRVVAVFVMGPAWQFKGWRWNGNPTEIFTHVAAFHVYFDGTKLDGNVAKWSVHQLKLHRDKRHLDRATLAKFWEVVDRHCIKNKAQLRF